MHSIFHWLYTASRTECNSLKKKHEIISTNAFLFFLLFLDVFFSPNVMNIKKNYPVKMSPQISRKNFPRKKFLVFKDKNVKKKKN